MIWRFSNKFPVPLSIGKLALNGQNFLHVLGVALGFGLMGKYMEAGMPVCVSTTTGIFRHLCVCHYVCTSIITFVHLLDHFCIYIKC